jgi:hypothetical protein
MHIKAWGKEIKDVRNGTVTMDSGDSLSVAYTDPNGKTHIFNVMAQHLVFMVTHEQTEATMMCRPAVGVQFVEPVKK